MTMSAIEIRNYYDSKFTSEDEGHIHFALREGIVWNGETLEDFCKRENLGNAEFSYHLWENSRDGIYRLLHNRYFPRKI